MIDIYPPVLRAFFRMVGQRWLEKIEAELWKYSQALNNWLYDLFLHPTPDWRDRLTAFEAEQELKGRSLTPESRAALVDYLEDWARGALPRVVQSPAEKLSEPLVRVDDLNLNTFETMIGLERPPETLDEIVDQHLPKKPIVTAEDLKPKLINVQVIRGWWGYYDDAVARGDHSPGFWERVLLDLAEGALPRNEPAYLETYDDGTQLLRMSAGPSTDALAGQATFLIGILKAGTAWGAIKETAEEAAEIAVEEAVGLPVLPTTTRKPKVVDKSWKSKISGKAQKTGQAGHDVRSYRIAIEAAKDPNVKSVHLNHGYNRALGFSPKTMSRNRRPDVLVEYHDRTIQPYEVQSLSDTPANLIKRNMALRAELKALGYEMLPPIVITPSKAQ